MPKGIKGFQKGNTIGKGRTPWNKGGLPLGLRDKLIERNKQRIGERHYMWKGDDVGYDALHNWVERVKGNPSSCELCGSIQKSRYKIHWANKSHRYKRDITDWLSLCVSCHTKYDGNYKKRKRDKKGRFVALSLGEQFGSIGGHSRECLGY